MHACLYGWMVDLLGSVLICDGYFFIMSMPVWLFINCLGNKLIFISSLDTVGTTVETVETVEDGIKPCMSMSMLYLLY